MDEKQRPTEKAGPCKSLGRLRLQSGVAVLYVAMGAMAALAVLDVACALGGAAERPLIGNAFEAFKLIAVTVLGYIFGADRARSGTGD